MRAKKQSTIAATALVVAGLGVGNMTAQPEKLPAPPAPEPVIIEGEKVEVRVEVPVPVRFEELKHTADKSLRKAFNLSDKAKNSDVVSLFKATAETVKSLTKENKLLRARNAEIVKMHNDLIQRARDQSAVSEYYEKNKKGVK